ncbi:MAG: NAD-dependent epimerase/dehydratase family protein, partial [Candidatus Cryptobacteroides sp.]
MKKTVFITGATGNMGWSGFKELYKKKDRFNIRILARPSKKNKEKLKAYMEDPAVTVIWGDLGRYEDVLEGVNGSDFVLHVGGMVSPAADYYPEKTMKVNVNAAKNVAAAVLAQPDNEKIGVVYIGSVAQCGDRLAPLHWGRAGDPVYASRFDKYSVSKCLADKVLVDSGI